MFVSQEKVTSFNLVLFDSLETCYIAEKNLKNLVKNFGELKNNFEVTQDNCLPPFTCSKLTTETLEQGVKYVQSLQQRH